MPFLQQVITHKLTANVMLVSRQMRDNAKASNDNTYIVILLLMGVDATRQALSKDKVGVDQMHAACEREDCFLNFKRSPGIFTNHPK